MITNKDIMQSYIMTVAKHDFTIYEQRVLLTLVDMAQCEVKGLTFVGGKDCRKIEHDLFDYTTVTIPISSILASETDKNHKKAKDALVRLSQKYLIFENDEVWEKINFVLSPKIQKRKSTFTFMIEPKIWDCILDFTKGFRRFELTTAMKFQSQYSVRFYELISEQKGFLKYSIDTLKEMFQVKDKYKKINDFKKKVLDVAQKELNEKSPWTFDYELKKTGRKITTIMLYPKYQPHNRDMELEKRALQKQVSPSWELKKEDLEYLKLNYKFSTKEIKQHIDLFKKASESIDFIGFLSKIKPRANRANNPKGYLINSIKKELKSLPNKDIEDLSQKLADKMNGK